MEPREFRALLDLLMVCDPIPIPLEQDAFLRGFANREAKKYGYQEWVHAYHEFDPLVWADRNSINS